MIRFEPCRAKHFEYITPTAVQSAEYRELLTRIGGDGLIEGVAYSAWVLGRCVGAAGVAPILPGVGEAWTMFSDAPETKGHILHCMRRMRNELDKMDYRRIELTVVDGNGNGHFIAKLMGFTLEARLEKRHVTGADTFLYKRIK